MVQGERLCGVIYAAYSHSQYLHMIPMERIFQDIKEVLGTKIVRVATAQDIYEYTRSVALQIPTDKSVTPHTDNQVENSRSSSEGKELQIGNGLATKIFEQLLTITQE